MNEITVWPERVFIAGYQCGGTMALRVAMACPQMFGGALSIGGAFPGGQSPLAKLAQIRKLPLFLAHCRDSATYTVDTVCDELRLFHSAGLASGTAAQVRAATSSEVANATPSAAPEGTA